MRRLTISLLYIKLMISAFFKIIVITWQNNKTEETRIAQHYASSSCLFSLFRLFGITSDFFNQHRQGRFGRSTISTANSNRIVRQQTERYGTQCVSCPLDGFNGNFPMEMSAILKCVVQ